MGLIKQHSRSVLKPEEHEIPQVHGADNFADLKRRKLPPETV